MRLALAFLLLAGMAAAETGDQRMIEDAEAAAYNAVGRLNVAGDRHCTATLIRADLVVTAAHCLYNMRTGRRAEPGDLRFVAGQRRDAYAALRDVVAVATPPGYAYSRQPTFDDIADDLALLALAAPIATEATAVAPADWPGGAASASIVAYGQDRAYMASIREGCVVTAVHRGVMALDCAVTFGVSGAPVLLDGPDGMEVIAVVSAMGEANGRGIAFAVPLNGRLEALRAALGAQ
jgi:protease YdgD